MTGLYRYTYSRVFRHLKKKSYGLNKAYLQETVQSRIKIFFPCINMRSTCQHCMIIQNPTSLIVMQCSIFSLKMDGKRTSPALGSIPAMWKNDPRHNHKYIYRYFFRFTSKMSLYLVDLQPGHPVLFQCTVLLRGIFALASFSTFGRTLAKHSLKR